MESVMTDDERYMRRCLQLALNGQLGAPPNPMVGAVIVAQGRIIGEGYHVRCGEGHAEVNAFASVQPADEALLPEATIYVSLEPCAHYGKTPPCADLIVRKGVKRVVVGCTDPFAKVQGRGIQKIKDAGIEVETGVLEKECQDLNRRFFTFHTQKRPYILLKWAQSINGFLDNAGTATRFSTPFTTMLAHKLRSEYDAILIGRITDEREHSLLNVREWYGKNPKRIVLSSRTGDLTTLISQLYNENIQSLIVEGGATTHKSFIDAGLWDELRIETAPVVIPSGTRAAAIPDNAVLANQEFWDRNTISYYRKNTK